DHADAGAEGAARDGALLPGRHVLATAKNAGHCEHHHCLLDHVILPRCRDRFPKTPGAQGAMAFHLQPRCASTTLSVAGVTDASATTSSLTPLSEKLVV